MRPHVLRHLVATGRAIPMEEFVESIARAASLDELRSIAIKQSGSSSS